LANQITDNRTQLADADGLTDGISGSWTGSTSVALDTDVKVEGTGSIAEQMTNSERTILWNAGTTINLSGQTVYIWVNCGVVGLLLAKASGGFKIRFAGPSTTNYFDAWVGGSDDWPNAVAGGWVQFAITVDVARAIAITASHTGGTPPASSAIQHIGIAATTSIMTKVSDNTWVDAIWRLPASTPGIIVEGRNGGTTDWSFSDIYTQQTAAAGCFRPGAGGSWVCNTPLQIGTDAGSIRQSIGNQNNASATLVVGSTQGWVPPAPGSLLVAGVGTTNSVTSVTDDSGSGSWAEAVPSVNATDSDEVAIWWKIANGSEANITFTAGTSSVVHMEVLELGGPWAASPVDVTVATSETSTNSKTLGPTATTTQADDFAVAIAMHRQPTTINSWSDGFTEQGQSTGTDSVFGLASKVLSATGAVSTTVGFGDTANSWGAIATFKLTSEATTTHAFSDINELVLWDNQEFISGDLYGLSALGNAGGTTNITLGVKTGTGDAATGAQGVVFQAASLGQRFYMDLDDPNLDSVGLYGCSFVHGADAQLDNAAVEVIGSLFLDCNSATLDGCVFLRNSVISPNRLTNVPWGWTADMSNIKFCTFQSSGTGHALTLTTTLVTPQTSKGNKFIGYAAQGGTAGDRAIYNNAGGAVTINVTDLGDTPTYRNGTGASTTVQNAVNITITVKDVANNLLDNIRVAVYDSGDTQLMNELTVSGIATESYAYTADENISIRIRKSSTGGTRYIPVTTTGTITSAGFALTVTLLEDPNVV
jgi:hypothetical protein